MAGEGGDGLATYCWLWVRLALVSIMALWLYFDYVDLLAKPVLSALGIADSLDAIVAEKPPFYYGVTIVTVVKFVVGILFWWRVVKVTVLLGSPFKFGVEVGNGRENDGKSGRLVTLGHIGDMNVYRQSYSGRFWFGLVARSHPGSDKIVRARVEFLVLALPCGRSLLIHESRFLLLKQNHGSRARTFRLVSDYYRKTTEQPSPDQFRRSMEAALKPIGEFFKKAGNVRRIDGLNWQEYSDGSGLIWDDFKYELRFEWRKDEGYKVVDDGEELAVGSVEELRELAKDRLHPVD